MMALLHSRYLQGLVFGPQNGLAFLFPAVVIFSLVHYSHSLKVYSHFSSVSVRRLYLRRSLAALSLPI